MEEVARHGTSATCMSGKVMGGLGDVFVAGATASTDPSTSAAPPAITVASAPIEAITSEDTTFKRPLGYEGLVPEETDGKRARGDKDSSTGKNKFSATWGGR